MSLCNDDDIQVATHGIIVGRAIVVGHEFVVGNAPFAGVRQQLNMAECVYNLDTSDVGSWMIMLGRINAARRGHSWYVRVVNLECTVRRL